MTNEDMFSEGLATMPANWLGFIADIKSDERLRGIIDNLLQINPNFFVQIGIDTNRELNMIREELVPFKKAPARQFVSLDHTTFNPDTLKEFDNIVKYGSSVRRKNNKFKN